MEDDIGDLVPATPPRAIIECRAWTRRRATKAAASPRRRTTTAASTASSLAAAATEAGRAAATSKIITAALPPLLRVPVLFRPRFVANSSLASRNTSQSQPLVNAVRTEKCSAIFCVFLALYRPNPLLPPSVSVLVRSTFSFPCAVCSFVPVRRRAGVVLNRDSESELN